MINLEKIKRLQAQAELVRIGGKGKFSIMENNLFNFPKMVQSSSENQKLGLKSL